MPHPSRMLRSDPNPIRGCSFIVLLIYLQRRKIYFYKDAKYKHEKQNNYFSFMVEESGDARGGQRGGKEREMKRESAKNSLISIGSLFVFWPQILPSVGFDRIQLDLSNPRMYTGVGLTDLAKNRSEIPSRVPFPPTVQILSHVSFSSIVQIPSTSVFNRRPERRRRTTKSFEREMVFFIERKKNDVF